MFITNLSTEDTDVMLQCFTDQDNYNQWINNFHIIAELKGVWTFYKGTEQILGKPDKDAILKPKGTENPADALTKALG